jgi:hypothetical protein
MNKKRDPKAPTNILKKLFEEKKVPAPATPNIMRSKSHRKQKTEARRGY